MESIRTHHDFRPLDFSAGFTLVELMVVLAIIITITMVIFTSHSSFNKTLVLANTAYDIALTIRSVESLGIGSRAIGATTNAGRGAHFAAGTPDSFILFADISPSGVSSCTALEAPDCNLGDNVYTSGSDTKVQTYTLGNGMTISNFCAYNGTEWLCSSGKLTSLDIIFARPNPDVFITTNNSTNLYSKACLTISSPQGGSRFISVGASGQISANAVSDPSSCHE